MRHCKPPQRRGLFRQGAAGQAIGDEEAAGGDRTTGGLADVGGEGDAGGGAGGAGAAPGAGDCRGSRSSVSSCTSRWVSVASEPLSASTLRCSRCTAISLVWSV